jgi:hypothetical protein
MPPEPEKPAPGAKPEEWAKYEKAIRDRDKAMFEMDKARSELVQNVNRYYGLMAELYVIQDDADALRKTFDKLVEGHPAVHRPLERVRDYALKQIEERRRQREREAKQKKKK